MEPSRDNFTGKIGFSLACIGSSVGMGNIWRFPIMVSLFGGLTFLIPYLIFVVFISSSGVMEEFALGRWARSGPMDAFGKCTEHRFGKAGPGKAIGVIPVLGAFGLAIGYTVVLGWITRYAVISITGTMFSLGTDMGSIASAFSAIAPEQDTLAGSVSYMLSEGIWNTGCTVWLILGIVISGAIMIFGVSGGIEKANKVMMPALFLLLLCLGIRVAFLDGAGAGYQYIFSINWKGFFNPTVWLFAFGQAFFSLSVAGNGSVIYGSYLGSNEDIPSSARIVAIFDTIGAMLAALVILPAMAAGGEAPSSGGPGLMFIYLVKVLNGLPGGRILGVVFFICVFFAGLSSIINLYEVPAAWLQDSFRMKRIPAVLIACLFGLFVAILIQPWTSQWMDIVSIYICPLGAFLAGVMFFWILDRKTAMESVNLGAKKSVGSLFYHFGKYVYCACSLFALIAGGICGGIG